MSKVAPDKHLHVESQISVLLGPWPAISMLLATVVCLSVSVFILQVEVATDTWVKGKINLGIWNEAKEKDLCVTSRTWCVLCAYLCWCLCCGTRTREMQAEFLVSSLLAVTFHHFCMSLGSPCWVTGYPPDPNWTPTAACSKCGGYISKQN